MIFLYISLSGKNIKNKQRIRKLKKQAPTDEIAKANLEKLQRKSKRRKKRNRDNLIDNIVLWCLLIGLGLLTLCYGVIPTLMDYIKKDYVVYTGEITVYESLRNSHIELEDGTTVWGRADFTEEDTFGTVVYSKRTKRVLGGQK